MYTSVVYYFRRNSWPGFSRPVSAVPGPELTESSTRPVVVLSLVFWPGSLPAVGRDEWPVPSRVDWRPPRGSRRIPVLMPNASAPEAGLPVSRCTCSFPGRFRVVFARSCRFDVRSRALLAPATRIAGRGSRVAHSARSPAGRGLRSLRLRLTQSHPRQGVLAQGSRRTGCRPVALAPLGSWSPSRAARPGRPSTRRASGRGPALRWQAALRRFVLLRRSLSWWRS